MVNLHAHSCYSLLDGIIKIPEYVAKCKSLGHTACAITDHGSVAGVVEFWRECKKQGMKGILGCEFYHERGQTNHHLILLAKNLEGYRNLITLNNLAQTNFHKKARINDDMLKKHGNGLICLTACIQGYLPQTILNGCPDWQWVEALRVWCDDVYLEVQNHGIPEEEKIMKVCLESGMKCVATTDSHYLNEEDGEAHEVALAIAMNKKKGDYKFNGTGYWILNNDEVKSRFPQVAIDMTDEVASKIENYDISHSEWQLPSANVEKEIELLDLHTKLDIYLWDNHIEDTDKYKSRLDYEFGVIYENGFLPYFKAVSRICQFVDEELKSLRGWGRGSAGGSLVAMLYGITKIDPIQYGLYFERFLNPDRISPPDIDLDFKPEDRQKVLEFMRSEFGNVYQIGTYTTLGSKEVINSVSRVTGIKTDLANFVPVEAPVPTIAELDQRDSFHKQVVKEGNENFIKICKTLEGLPRSMSAHASGVVIDQHNEIPLRISKSGASANIPVCALDMYALDDIKLVKYDILGVNQLSIIDATCKKMGINIENIPLDDAKTYENFNSGNTLGVFQFETHSYSKLIQRLHPDNFEELIGLNAIGRPACLESGMTDQYIDRKFGREESKPIHPALPNMNFFNLPLFQENMMQISRDFAGFTMSEADTLRKAIGKKKKELMEELRPKFVLGAQKTRGVTEQEAIEVWEVIEKAGRYSWNLSHAVCYTLISYWTMYLSAHYPVQYFAELLNGAGNVGDTAMRRRVLLSECRRRNIPIRRPDINLSSREYSVVDNGILLGLSGIKFVGESNLDKIFEERNNGHFINSDDVKNRTGVDKRVIEYLKKAGCFTDEYNSNRDDEIESLGYSISGRIIDQGYRKYVKEAGEIIELKETTTKKGDPMAFMTVDFHSEMRSVVVFPKQHQNYREFLKKGNAFAFYCDGDILQFIGSLDHVEDMTIEIPDDKVDEFLSFCPRCNGKPNIYSNGYAVATVSMSIAMYNFIEREFGIVRIRLG